MADKEKDLSNSIISAVTLLPVALGITKYRKEVLDALRNVSNDISTLLGEKADDIPFLNTIAAKLRNLRTISGSKPKADFLKSVATRLKQPIKVSESLHADLTKESKIAENILQKRKAASSESVVKASQIKFHEDLMKDLLKVRTSELIKTTMSAQFDAKRTGGAIPAVSAKYINDIAKKSVFGEIEQTRKYAAFLAYKEAFGVRVQDIATLNLTPELLNEYYKLYEAASKGDSYSAMRMRETYVKHLDDIRKDSGHYLKYLERNIKPEAALLDNTRQKPWRLSSLEINTGLDDIALRDRIVSFIEHDDVRVRDKWNELVSITNLPKDRSKRQAESIVKAIREWQSKLKNTQKQADKSADFNYADPQDKLRALVTKSNMDMVEMRVLLRREDVGNFTHKSIVFELYSDVPGKNPLRASINIQSGAFVSRGSSSMPVVTPLQVQTGHTSTLSTMDVTTLSAQRLYAMSDNVMRDLYEKEGDPSRSQGLIDSIHKQVFAFGSPVSGTPRDFITSLSTVFHDVNMAVGKATEREYRKMLRAVPSMQTLQKLGTGNYNVLVFDLEFTNPDMIAKQLGSQKVVADPRTKIYNFSARVINTRTWEEVAVLDTLIDPLDKQAYKDIREFYRFKAGVNPADIDKFIEHELKGAPAKLGNNRYRYNSFGDAFSVMLDLAHKHNVQSWVGHNIGEADIPLLLKQLELLKDEKHPQYAMYASLKQRAAMYLNGDPFKGTDHNIDTFFNEHIFNINDPSASNKLEIAFKRYTNIDQTAFGAVLKQGKLFTEGLPLSELESIAKEYDVKLDDLKRVYEYTRKMKLATVDSALGIAHYGAFDTAIDSILLMLQQKKSGTITGDMVKYETMHRVAVDVLSKGNTSWQMPFRAMDSMRPGIFYKTDTPEDDSFAISLFSSSQQQAAKLIGSMLHMQNLVPFGLFNNMMRQRYQAFSSWYFTQPSEAAIQEAAKRGIEYMPGYNLSTDQGKKLVEAARLSQLLSNPEDLPDITDPEKGGLHTARVMPIMRLPESFIGTHNDQGIFNSAYSGLTTYSHGHPHVKSIQIDLPLKWRGLTAEQIFDGTSAYQGVKDDLHKAIQRAVKSRISVNPKEHTAVNTGISMNKAGEIFDFYAKEGIDAVLPDGTKVSDYLISKNDSMWRAGTMFNSSPVRYESEVPSVVIDSWFDQETGKVNVTMATMNQVSASTKVSVDLTKSAKVFIGSVTDESAEAPLRFGSGTEALIIPMRFGGKRKEIGSFYTVQLNRIIRKIDTDPRLNSNPERMELEFRRSIRGFLGMDNIKVVTHKLASGNKYRLEVIMSALKTSAEYKSITAEGMLNSLREAGLTFGYVESKFKESVDALADAQEKSKAWKSYDELFRRHITQLEKHIHELQANVTQAKDSSAHAKAVNSLNFYSRLLTSVRKYYNNGDFKAGDKNVEAWFDVDIVKYGNRLAASMVTLDYGSVSVIGDVLDLVDRKITDVVETETKMPAGFAQRAYFTTFFEENLVKFGATPEDAEKIITKGLGITYINVKAERPIADTVSVLRQSLEFLKRGPNAGSDISNVDELFKATEWLSDYDKADEKAIIKSIHGRDKYRILTLEDARKLGKLLSNETLANEVNKRLGTSGALRSTEELVEEYARQHNLQPEEVRSRFGIEDPRIFVDTLQDSPIFKSNEARLNLLKVETGEQILKSMGISAEAIKKSPGLDMLAKLDLSIDYYDDIVNELSGGTPISDEQKHIWKIKLQQAGLDKAKTGFIPIPTLTGALKPHEFKEFNMSTYIKDASLRSISDVMEAYTRFHDSIVAAGNAMIKDAAATKEYNDALTERDALKNMTKDYLKTFIGGQIKRMSEEGNLFRGLNKYQLHASSFQQLPAALLNVLKNPEIVSEKALRNVITLGHGGTEEAARVAKMTIDELRQEAGKLLEKNKKHFTFQGFGLLEGVITKSEATDIKSTLTERLTAELETGSITKSQYESFNTRLSEWLHGRSTLPDLSLKEPSFTYMVSLIRQVSVLDDEIWDLAGISKLARKSSIYMSPVQAAYTGRSDLDGDQILRKIFGDLRSVSVMDEVHRRQLHHVARMNERKHPVKDVWPFRMDKMDSIGDRKVFQMADTSSIIFDTAKDIPDLTEKVSESLVQDVKQSIVIKAFTGQIGGASMQMIESMYGPQAGLPHLSELLKLDKNLADELFKRTQISHDQISTALNFLMKTVEENDIRTTAYEKLMFWHNQLSERISIMKEKSGTGSKPIEMYLADVSELSHRLRKGRLTESDIEFARKDTTLLLNEAAITSEDFFGSAVTDTGEDVATQALKHANILFRASSEIKRIRTGNPYGEYKDYFSKEGVGKVTALLKSLIDERPEMAPTIAIRRFGAEKALGLGVDYLNMNSGDIAFGDRNAAKSLFFKNDLTGLISEWFGVDNIRNSVDDIARKMINANWRGPLKTSLLALGAVMFMSPNMGVEPVGRGGEAEDFPELRDEDATPSENRFHVSIRPPSPILLDKLMSMANPGKADKPINLKLPPKPMKRTSTSNIRRSPATMDEYIRRADAVLLT